MAVIRFKLDLSQLDDAAYGLDGPSGRSFILDSSQLDGADVLNGSPFLTTATASSSLGGLDASVTATVTQFAVLSSSLGGLDANVSATVTQFAVLSSSLGGLDASAIAQAEGFPVFTATLGGMVASATAVVTPINPEPVVGGSKYRYTKHRKKLAEQQQYEEPVVIVQPKHKMQTTHLAFAHSILGGATIQASGSITFSILDDDAEILLLV